MAHKVAQALMNMEINVSQPQFNFIQPFTSSTLALTHTVKTVKDFSFDELNIIDVCNNLVVVFVSLRPQDIQSSAITPAIVLRTIQNNCNKRGQ